ncbi:hypothetical protein LTS18_014393 [Coniosporium uncinatum]|uniref:Uncharacterized protein n=1 Tax=Coniosporium uncinatum TaxID=93489 RepID=A0ACC3DZ78_9PEZI|nr:hypothetical protein LTS18_014393 [Coniosporium uncinatum]
MTLEVLERVVLLEGTSSGDELSRELITLLDNGKSLLYAGDDEDQGAELGKALGGTLDGVLLLDGFTTEEGPGKELELTLDDGIALLYTREDAGRLKLERAVVLTTKLGMTVAEDPQSPLVYRYDHGQL